MAGRRVTLTKKQLETPAGAELLEVCEFIKSDGKLSKDEIVRLANWLYGHRECGLPAVEFLYGVVKRIVEDKRVSVDELAELAKAIESVLPADARRPASGSRRERPKESGIPRISRIYSQTESDLNPKQKEFYDHLRQQISNGIYPDVHPWETYLYIYATDLARNACSNGFGYTHYVLFDLAEEYSSTGHFAGTCRLWALDCLLALEQYDEFLDLSEPVEPFGADTHGANLRLNVQHILGRDGLGVDFFRMAEGRVTSFTRKYPGVFREVLDRCFEEDAELNGRWLSRIIGKLDDPEPRYQYQPLSGLATNCGSALPSLNTYCFYAANGFDSRTKTFTYDFNDVIRQCARKAENLLREQFGVPRVGEGWVSETALYHALRKAFPETAVIHHGQPTWLCRQHFDIWFPNWLIAVERHGRQHFQPIEFFGGVEGFNRTVERDRRKWDLARKHGVRLITVTRDIGHAEVIELVKAARTIMRTPPSSSPA